MAASQLDSGTDTAVVNQTIISASKADPCQIGITGTTLVNGDSIFISDVAGMVELNDIRYEVTNKQTNTVDLLGIDSSGFTTWSSGASDHVKNIRHVLNATTPQLTDGVFDLTVDHSVLARGDSVFYWIREKTTGTGDGQLWRKIGVFNHDQGDSGEQWESLPYALLFGWDLLIEQWAGTGRAFVWSIRQA